jgi:hypothetical protein
MASKVFLFTMLFSTRVVAWLLLPPPPILIILRKKIFVHLRMKEVNRMIWMICIVLISIWALQLYRDRCFKIEYYTDVSDKALLYIREEKKLNPERVMHFFDQLSGEGLDPKLGSPELDKEVYASVSADDRQNLMMLLAKMKKKNALVKDK